MGHTPQPHSTTVLCSAVPLALDRDALDPGCWVLVLRLNTLAPTWWPRAAPRPARGIRVRYHWPPRFLSLPFPSLHRPCHALQETGRFGLCIIRQGAGTLGGSPLQAVSLAW